MFRPRGSKHSRERSYPDLCLEHKSCGALVCNLCWLKWGGSPRSSSFCSCFCSRCCYCVSSSAFVAAVFADVVNHVLLLLFQGRLRSAWVQHMRLLH